MKKKFQINTKITNHYLLLDLETVGRNPYTTEPCEISAIVIDCDTLEIKEGGEFSSLCRPTDWSLVQEEALAKNKITREALEAAPEQEFVFRQFCEFTRKFTRSDKLWDQLVACGYNINSFDMTILDRMCFKYNYVSKSGDPMLYHPIHRFDCLDIIRLFGHNCDELPAYNLDAICDYFGINRAGSHRGLIDCKNTYLLLKRFLTYFRQLSPKMLPKFRGCFSNESK